MPIAIVASPFVMMAEQGKVRQPVTVADSTGRIVARPAGAGEAPAAALITNSGTIVCSSEHGALAASGETALRCNRGYSAIATGHHVFGGPTSFDIGVARGAPAESLAEMRIGDVETICTANYNSRKSEAEPFILDCGPDNRVLSRMNASGLGRVGTAAATTVRIGPESFRTTVWINLDKV